MKRKLILGSCVCIVITIFNFANMLNVDDLKLELLFDKIEALAAGETLPLLMLFAQMLVGVDVGP